MLRTPEDKIIAINIVMILAFILTAWLFPPWASVLLIVLGGPVALSLVIRLFIEGVRRRMDDERSGTVSDGKD